VVHVDDGNVVYLFQKSWSFEQSDPLMLRLVTLVDCVTMMMMLREEQPQEHNNVAFLQSGVLHLNANQPLCFQGFLQSFFALVLWSHAYVLLPMGQFLQ
jgi:hypothetical protein